MMPKQFSAVAAGRETFRERAALVGEAIDGRKALYLIRVMFWPPQMPIAQPSTRIVVGPSSRRCPT
jgi:hypothetical protein